MENWNLLTAGEVAIRLDKHPRTIKRWLSKGRLRGYKFGGTWKVREKDLKEYIEQSRGG